MIKNDVKVHNNYKAKVVNNKGEIVSEGYAENIVLDRFWNNATGRREQSQFRYIKIGTGLPTEGSEIDPSNTSLFNAIGNFIEGEDVEVTSELSGNTRISTKKMTCTVPAAAEYEGDITEVGCYGNNSNSTLNSHALFRDSEGNPISITKSDVDVMVIEVTIYVVINYEGDVIPTKNMDVISERILLGDEGFLYGPLPIALTTLPEVIGSSNNLNATTRALAGMVGTDKGDFIVDTQERKLSYSKFRSSDTQENNGFANYIQLYGIGSVKLPNSNYSQAYQVEDVYVDKGDGVKTSFTCPIPEFIRDTDVIKVDGAPLERDVDYTLDPENNSMIYASSMASHKNKFKVVDTSTSGSRSIPIHYGWYLHYDSSNIELEYEDEIYVESVYIDESLGRSFYASLSYSQDGVEYTEVINVTGNDELGLIDLEAPITAKFWKINAYNNSTGRSLPICFGKKPSNLVFTTPPPVGSEITLTCTVDRPFKSKDFIFDTSYEVSY